MYHFASLPAQFVDDAGRLILRLPVTNRPGRFFKIAASDFAKLSVGRRSIAFYANDDGKGRDRLRVVLMNAKGTRVNNAQPGRLIMDPPPGFRVHFTSGDNFDLTPGNLILRPHGTAGRRKVRTQADAIASKADALAAAVAAAKDAR